MKKFYSTFIVLLFSAQLSSAQLINAGFENWNAGLPDNWWGLSLPPYNIFSQSTTSHSDSFAVNLHVDTAFGGVIASLLSTGNGSGVSTHPLTIVPGSLSFWYKLNSVSGDELSVTSVVYSGGNGVGVIATTFPAAAAYTQASANFMYVNPPATADSIGIIFTITGGSGTAHAGTDALIDDVSISVTSGIPSAAKDLISFYPNPAYETAVFETTSGIQNELFVYELSGKEVYHVITSELKHFIDLTSFPSGSYLYMAINRNGVFRNKFQIIH